MRSIGANHVAQLLKHRQDSGGSPSSVRSLCSFTARVLRAHGNTAADAIRVRAPRPVRTALTQDEAGRLRAALEGHPRRDVTAGLLVLLGTGLRLGELLALQPQDWRRPQLYVAPGKTGRDRLVDVPDWAMPALEEWLTRTTTVYDRLLRRVLDQAAAAAGVPRLKVHGLRHTRATCLLMAGAPILYVSRQLGHSSSDFTLRVYGHLVATPPDQARAWANLA